MLSEIIQNLNSKTFKNTILLLGGTILSQLIPLAIMPVLTRIFTVDEHGLFTLYFTILSSFSIVATLRYELAIIIPSKKKTSDTIILVSLISAIIVSLILLVAFLVFKNQINNIYNFEALGDFIYLLPFSILCNGIIQTFSYKYNRENKYKYLSIIRISLSVVANILPLFLMYFFKEKGVLIISYIFGQFIVIVTLIIQNAKEVKSIINNINYRLIKLTALKYRDFPIYNTASSLIDQIAGAIPFYFINESFGLKAAGLYGMSIKIISIPSAFISYSISQVLFNKASVIYNENKPLKPVVLKVVLLLFLLGLVPFIIILLFGNKLFGFVLGEQWVLSGHYAKILAVSSFIKFIISPISLLLAVVNKLKTAAIWQILYFLANILLIQVGYISGNIEQYLYLLLVIDIVFYILYFIIIYKNLP